MGKTSDNLSSWQKVVRILLRLGFFISIALVLCCLLVVLLYGLYRNEIPSVSMVKDYHPSLKSKVFAHNGELIAEFGINSRILVDKGDFSPLVIQAFVSSEDKNFYRHHGIDFMGVASAVLQSLTGQRSSLRGASTLTQQLAKSLLVKKEGYEQATARTVSRKVKEAILARRLEMYLSKEDIIWMYLNEVYLGHGAYGVAAAARAYFQKDLKSLKLKEIALLAGLPQAPSRFSPQDNLSAALARQSYVLSRMRDDGFISAEQHDEALADNQNLKVYERENNFRKSAPYFSEQVRRMLMEEYGEDKVYEDGLNIFTTLDLEHERFMQRALKTGLIDVDKRQGFLGPIYRPTDKRLRDVAKLVVDRVNVEDLLQMPAGYQLAMVERVDSELDAVFIDMGRRRGVIPLAGMYWARPRDPNANYDWWKLRGVFGVLNTGDVVLVKEQTVANMEALNQDCASPTHLSNLQNHLRNDREHRNLGLFSLEQEPSIEGAMVAMEVGSGYVTAMDGGYSFDKSEFNRVYQACRQPGSAFKPVVYTAAIALKKYTPATMIMDAPLTFHDEGTESSWKPKNLGQRYKGEVTVREAVMRSINVPTLNVMADVGTKNVLEWAEKLGIKSKLKPELGTGIGSSCVTPWELSRVFSTIANQGVSVEPILIREVRDRDHKRIKFKAAKTDPWITRNDRVDQILDDFFGHKDRVMEKEDAYTMHYLLTEVAKNGTAQRTNVLHRHLAGKTGTTNDSFDTWFAGYSKSLLSLVWIGNDMMDTPLGVYEQGGRTALPLFNNFMGPALLGLPDEDWQMPATMCEARIDSQTGHRITEDHPLSFLAPFRCGQEPALMDRAPSQSLEQAMEFMGGM